MKTILLSLLASLFLLQPVRFYAQSYQEKPETVTEKTIIDGLPVFTEDDLKEFKNLPKLELPANLRNRSLPVNVNNAELPYFRPIFDQVALECGQASGVAYTFTYEINRLRDLPANIIENQYPTHFVYNWSGMGNGTASSYFDSWNIIKKVGTPNVVEYGGSLNYGGIARWVSGYNIYYSAMQNRLWDFYSIDVTTEEGLNTLKHWIDNHLEEAETGGVGNIYTAAIGANNTLPSGTPEGGKKVILELPTYSNHALAVVGYHDSIRYDLNNDGQYTNHIDINNDGVVDIKDWEMGGVILANSYYASSWGDAGFAYLLYSGLCRKMPEKGPWNGAVHVIKAKENVDPQMTFKVTLTHDSRNKIKVMAGVATTPGATQPEHIIDFPILNYQGGNKYMKGGNSEEDKKLEFGLDVTPLLEYAEGNGFARFFLLVNEDDPGNQGTGLINDFSLMDYTQASPVETPCAETNVPLIENGLTTIWVDTEMNFETPEIINQELPPATINEPYQTQMFAGGGTEPFQWKVKQNYLSGQSSSQFPMITQNPLSPNNSSSGYVTQEIDFEFPFYGNTYNQITLHTDGYILFEEDHYPWIFLLDQVNLFKNARNIAPMMSNTLGTQGGGMWYEGNSIKATFRWKTTEYSTGNTQNFAVSLYADGKIELYYGDYTIAPWNFWWAGISEGDDFNYELLDISNTQLTPNTMITIEPDFGFTEMSITEEGLFYGTPTRAYEAVEIDFCATDVNGLRAKKELLFSTDGVNSIIIKDVIVQSGDNTIIENGETATLSVELRNLTDEPVNAVSMQIATDNQYITLIDNFELLEPFAPGESRVIEAAFQFEVAIDVPNNHNLIFGTEIQTDADIYNSYIYLKAYAPQLSIGTISMDDGNNGYPEPGETVEVSVQIKNTGGGKAYGILSELSNNDPFVIITQNSFMIEELNAGATANAEFEIQIDDATPMGYTSSLMIESVSEHGFSATGSFGISIGLSVENFETGTFESFDWQFSGNADWYIDSFDPWQGEYCMRSGTIGDDNESVVSVTMDVVMDSEISFFYQVSSESNYDYLKFYINGNNAGQWSGDQNWSYVSYPVQAGEVTFTWAYEKDYSVSNGLDCAFIDYIIFPPNGEQSLAIFAGPDLTICENQIAQLEGFVSLAQSLEWASSGDGTFDDPTIISPQYFPGVDDITTGEVELWLTGWDASGNSLSDTLNLSVTKIPWVWAGGNQSGCDNTGIAIAGQVLNAESSLWLTEGDGTFEDPTNPETTYYPGSDDLQNGEALLILQGYPASPCTDIVFDMMTAVVLPAPEVYFDVLPVMGLNWEPYELTEGSPEGGEYSGPGVIDGWMYPEVAGVGTHTLEYNYVDENGCSNTAQRQVVIEVFVGTIQPVAKPLSILPNPAKDVFYVTANSNLSGEATFELFNGNGNKVLRDIRVISGNEKTLQVNCAGLPAGIYYLKITTANEILSGKVILR
jgi:hypothetical protein